VTEQEWRRCRKAFPLLRHVRTSASVRKLSLVAAAYGRWLQSLAAFERVVRIADFIEEVADGHRSWDDFYLCSRSETHGSDFTLFNCFVWGEEDVGIARQAVGDLRDPSGGFGLETSTASFVFIGSRLANRWHELLATVPEESLATKIVTLAELPKNVQQTVESITSAMKTLQKAVAKELEESRLSQHDQDRPGKGPTSKSSPTSSR
jgi:hypothetical protein